MRYVMVSVVKGKAGNFNNNLRKEVFQKEEFDKLGKIDYHRKKADENITRRLIKTTLGKWKDEYKAQTI